MPVMAEERPRLDLERQAQAKVYSRLQRRVGLLEMALGLAYLLLWIGTGAAVQLAGSIGQALPRSWPAELVTMAVCLAVPWFLVTLPFGYYTGFHLPHRFGQSTQTLSGWLTDLAKSLLVGACLGLPLLLGLYAVMRAWPQTWWAIAGAGFLGFSILLSILAPVVLMPLFNRFRPLGDERADLAQRLMRLSAAAGRKVRGVYSFDMSRRTRSANAALVGLGRTRRIVLGDTLLDEFPSDEIEAVLAHELGHHVHGDIPVGVLIGSGVMLLNLWIADAVLTGAAARGVLSAPTDLAGLPIFALVFFVLGFFTGPLENAYSRWRERQADAFSVRLTGRPHAFADAMTRLANQNLADANPPRWAVILFGTHPPLEERIGLAEAAVTPPAG
jgi:STE24 endopeptidase